MKLPLKFDKCILCLEKNADSWEHIIPECIGGRLELENLCSDCNHKLGSELISQIPDDPSIRLAVYHVRSQIPKLFKSFEMHLTYFAEDKCGIIRMKRKGSKMKVFTEKKDNNVFIMDTKDSYKHISKLLEKEGLTSNEISNKIKSFKNAENNIIVPISKTLKAERSSGKKINISLEGPRLDKRIPALIAYEFLSLIINNQIYNTRFDFIRDFIIENIKCDKLVIEEIQGKYELCHIIFPKFLPTEIIINIFLFGWHGFRVYLKGFQLSPPELVYLEDLRNSKVRFFNSIDELK